MIQYYEKVRDIDKNKIVISAVILDGENVGEKALWCDGSYVYQSQELNIWDEVSHKLKQMTKPQSIEVDGVRIFCEVINGQNHLIVCGAGHVSIPVIKIGKMLGFYVTVIDDRVQFTNHAIQAGADHVICDDFMSGLESIEDNVNNYFVIVTRGHRYDQDCLRKILNRPSSYIGMIGSKLRVKKVKETMLEEGFNQESLDYMHSPIGLSIGAETPEEIAVSIMAEIIQIKSNQSSNSGITKELLNKILQEEKLKMAMVTIISRRGSAPRNIGAKMLISEDGSFLGSIGGGCAESDVFYKTLQYLKEDRFSVETVDMTGTSYEEDGMVCGGLIDVFIEPIHK
ncbi:MAG TPA: XdhC family protein [Candidatus Merdenecus merdavium]|nr:XdhC family protein [Candidatus Merdenecus merdavium]